jgi:hypothetical protein
LRAVEKRLRNQQTTPKFIHPVQTAQDFFQKLFFSFCTRFSRRMRKPADNLVQVIEPAEQPSRTYPVYITAAAGSRMIANEYLKQLQQSPIGNECSFSAA